MRGVWLEAAGAWARLAVPVLMALLVFHTARAEAAGPRPGPAKRSRPVPQSPPTAGLPGGSHRPPAVAHHVRPGETLWSIARGHGVALDALRRANRLAPGQTIRAGQRLAIPGEVSVQERQEPPSPAEIVLGPPPRGVAVAFSWPVAAPTRSGFGPRGDGWHGGIDLAAEPGSPIRAAAPGMVVTSGWERGYGNVVKVWHADDLMTVYAHNRENHVRPGDWVERGQIVGTVGGTGRATAPHLHFEIRLAGRKYDPLFFLPEPGGVEVAASTPAAAGRPR